MFSRKVLAGASPRVVLSEDNTDQFSSAALEGSMAALLPAYNQRAPAPRATAGATLAAVEIYPYVPYIQFLLPGTIVLAIFVTAMIGGGIIFIDDKARGLHEGYLVTPIGKFELILGFNLAGVVKAVVTGVVLVTVGSVIAGIPDPLNLARMARMMVLVVVTALALISMMFLLMVRVTDPLIPRAVFGMLNTVLFFPSGAVYPTQAFPAWMQRDHHGGSVHLRGAWVQATDSQEHRPAGHCARHCLSPGVRRRSPWAPPPSSSAAPSDRSARRRRFHRGVKCAGWAP